MERFIAAREKLSKKTIHNHFTLLIAMLNFAHDLGWLARMPRIKKPAHPRPRRPDYQYLRTDAEVRRFLVAADAQGPMVYSLYATAVYSEARGKARRCSLGGHRLTRRLITIQRSFAGPTTADDVRYAGILDVLLPVLRDGRLENPLPIVFPGETGAMLGDLGRVFQERFHRFLSAAGFGKAQRGGKLRPYISFHDLRHTFASQWMVKGGDLFKLQKVLGNKSTQSGNPAR